MRSTITNVATWTGFAVLLLLVVMLGGSTGVAAQCMAAISILVMAIHAIVALGWSEVAIFAASCLTITFAMENIGTTTGFPFGRYAFLVGARLPHVGSIPIIVGALYFGMGYASWVMASLLVGHRVERPKTRYALVAVPLVAAFVMTQWDVVMDPSGSTLGKAWAWYDSGAYFGVPLSNFLGWLLVTWLYFQAFAIISYLSGGRPVPYSPNAGARRQTYRCRRTSLVSGRPPRNGGDRDALHHGADQYSGFIASSLPGTRSIISTGIAATAPSLKFRRFAI
jgi:putative membrane protein